MKENEDNSHSDESDDSMSNNDITNLTPQRHGCVTAWLVLMLIANSVTLLIYLFTLFKGAPNSKITLNTLIALLIIGVLNVVFSIMLLSWKKSAFYGLGITAIVTFFVNISIGISLVMATIGLVGFGILYGILQIKKDEISAWDNMQ